MNLECARVILTCNSVDRFGQDRFDRTPGEEGEWTVGGGREGEMPLGYIRQWDVSYTTTVLYKLRRFVSLVRRTAGRHAALM